MSRIFKEGSIEQELLEGMEAAQLESVAEEEGRQEQMIVKAMEHLNAAAEVFERAGSGMRAKEVTAVMMSLSKKEDKDSKSKSKSKKSSSKDEATKVFKFFGFSPDDLGSDFSSGGDGGDGE